MLRSQHYIADQCIFLWASLLLNTQPFSQHFQNCVASQCKFFTFYFPGAPGSGRCWHLSSKWLTLFSKLRFRASVLAASVAKPTLHRSSVQFCLFFFLLNTQPFPQHFQNCVGSQILHFWNRVPPGRWFPFGPGITQGVETRYKGYLRVRGRSRINGRVGFLEVGSPDPVSVAGHPEV